MGLRSDHQADTSYRKTPVIPGTGKTVCLQHDLDHHHPPPSGIHGVYMQRFTVEVMIEFLRHLIRHTQGKVFLILDGHPGHRCGKVKKGIEKHVEEIRLFYLPGYSPEFNPDELLNQDFKSSALGRRRPRELEEMIGNVRSYLRSTQK